MRVRIMVIDHPAGEILERAVDISRVPVLGEYIRDGEEWFQVKRVVHNSNSSEEPATVFAVTIVDPTREPIRMSEWMESAP